MDIECTVILPILSGDISRHSTGFDLVGTQNNIYLKSVPAIVRLTIFIRFTAYEPHFNRRFSVLIKVIDEDGKVIKSQDGGEKTIAPKYDRHLAHEDLIYRLHQLELTSFGVHEISISIDGVEKATLPFEVVEIET